MSDFQEMFLAEELAPFGERRQDIRAGIIAATVANVAAAYVAGQAKQPFEPVDIDDFMLPLMPRKQVQAEASVNMEKQIMEMLFIQQVQNMILERDGGT